MFTRNTSSEAGRRICLSDATPTSAAPRLRLPASSTHPTDSFPGSIYVAGDALGTQAPRPRARTSKLHSRDQGRSTGSLQLNTVRWRLWISKRSSLTTGLFRTASL